MHGVGLYLFGPNQFEGLVRSLKTGSNKTRTPLSAREAAGNSTKTEAWPIQVARSLSFLSAPKPGVTTLTNSSDRVPFGPCGTGTKFLSDPKRAERKAPIPGFSPAEGHGLRKAVGGRPIWWSFDGEVAGFLEGPGVTVMLAAIVLVYAVRDKCKEGKALAEK
jgi:hypothetical protein